jgi:hypothetical protein
VSSTFKVGQGPLAKMEPMGEMEWTDVPVPMGETEWTVRMGWTVRPENQDPPGPKDHRGSLDPRDHPGRLVRMQSRPPPPPSPSPR